MARQIGKACGSLKSGRRASGIAFPRGAWERDGVAIFIEVNLGKKAPGVSQGLFIFFDRGILVRAPLRVAAKRKRSTPDYQGSGAFFSLRTTWPTSGGAGMATMFCSFTLGPALGRGAAGGCVAGFRCNDVPLGGE